MRRKISPITQALAAHIYETAFDGHSLANECDRGVVNTHRVWWVQAETVVGFLNACEQMPDHSEYRDAALAEWQFIKEHVIDPRRGSEWYWEVYEDGSPILDQADRGAVEMSVSQRAHVYRGTGTHQGKLRRIGYAA